MPSGACQDMWPAAWQGYATAADLREPGQVLRMGHGAAPHIAYKQEQGFPASALEFQVMLRLFRLVAARLVSRSRPACGGPHDLAGDRHRRAERAHRAGRRPATQRPASKRRSLAKPRRARCSPSSRSPSSASPSTAATASWRRAPSRPGSPASARRPACSACIQKNRYHRSNIYSGAPMPFMQRITWSGVALHAGVVPGYPASHGCIRLTHQFAAELWGMTRMGARVVVAPDDADRRRDRQPAPAGADHDAGARRGTPAPTRASPSWSRSLSAGRAAKAVDVTKSGPPRS